MVDKIQFPIYVVASRDGVVVVTTDGNDCILLFHSQAIAEQQIANIQTTHPALGPLHALAVPNVGALREGLRELPSSVTCAVWDADGNPAGFKHVCLDEL